MNIPSSIDLYNGSRELLTYNFAHYQYYAWDAGTGMSVTNGGSDRQKKCR